MLIHACSYSMLLVYCMYHSTALAPRCAALGIIQRINTLAHGVMEKSMRDARRSKGQGA